jgi:hypothetical protein
VREVLLHTLGVDYVSNKLVRLVEVCIYAFKPTIYIIKCVLNPVSLYYNVYLTHISTLIV